MANSVYLLPNRSLETSPAKKAVAGTCRYCGCTQNRACVLSCTNLNLVTCSWFDAAHTICTNPICVGEYVHDEMRRDPTLTAAQIISSTLAVGGVQ